MLDSKSIANKPDNGALVSITVMLGISIIATHLASKY